MAETGLQENNTTIGDVTLSTTDITSNFPMKLMFSDPCSFVYLTKDDIEHPVLPQNSQSVFPQSCLDINWMDQSLSQSFTDIHSE